jgi:hypothetical protein
VSEIEIRHPSRYSMLAVVDGLVLAKATGSSSDSDQWVGWLVEAAGEEPEQAEVCLYRQSAIDAMKARVMRLLEQRKAATVSALLES